MKNFTLASLMINDAANETDFKVGSLIKEILVSHIIGLMNQSALKCLSIDPRRVELT